jgi:predicted TIM-barrel fold metal-dependent hydrolase
MDWRSGVLSLVLAFQLGCDGGGGPAPASEARDACAALAADGTLPIFDAHFHWISPASDAYTAEELLARMDEGAACRSIVSSTPNDRTLELWELAPTRVVPAFRLYRTEDDKFQWSERTDMGAFMGQGLPEADFAALGEFHLFEGARLDAPGLQALVEAARSSGLDLLAHVEPTHIDYLFEAVPGTRIIWDHAGFQTPAMLEPYLERYPSLWVDLAGRDEDVAPGGNLDPAWADLIERYPDRFMVGSDPWTVELSTNYVWTLETIRHWVAQLPPDVAAKVAYRNGQELVPTANP